MRRASLSALLLLGVCAAAHAQDVVYYTERGKKGEQKATGSVEDESPAGVKVKLKDGKDTMQAIATGAILRIDYQDKAVSVVDYRRPFGKEEQARKEARDDKRAERLGEALDGYAKLEKAAERPAVKRYLQFKVAELTTLQSQDDPTKADAAIKLLTEFKGNHPTGWQLLPALKMLARLLEDAGRLDDARKAYEELADLPDVPAELKQESTLLVSRLLLRGGKYRDAEARLRKLAPTLSRDDPQALLVKAYLAESALGQNNLKDVAKDLGEVARASADPRLRGVVHNLLGDYYRKQGQAEEAFWEYLRVETVYNEDVEENAKALYFLVGLFDKVKKDPLRGKDCATKLLDKRFAGTVYQRTFMQETKK